MVSTMAANDLALQETSNAVTQLCQIIPASVEEALPKIRSRQNTYHSAMKYLPSADEHRFHKKHITAHRNFDSESNML